MNLCFDLGRERVIWNMYRGLEIQSPMFLVHVHSKDYLLNLKRYFQYRLIFKRMNKITVC